MPRLKTKANAIRRELEAQGVYASTDCILTALKRGDTEAEIKAMMSMIMSDILTKEGVK